MHSTGHPSPRRGEPADCRVSVGVHGHRHRVLSTEWELFPPGNGGPLNSADRRHWMAEPLGHEVLIDSQ